EAFAQFIQLLRVLDGDDGLGGEVRQQFDLFVSKRTHFLPVDDDGTNQHVILEHRNVDQGSRASKFHSGNPQRVALGVSRARSQVFGLNYLLGLYQPSKTGLRARTYRGTAPPPFDKGGGGAVHRDNAEFVAFAEEQVAELGVADAHRIFQHGLEHRLQFAGRRTDDA